MRSLSRLAIQLALASPALAQSTWYVDASNAPPGSGTRADPYTSIQQAIDAPSTVRGDTIRVSPGLYVENVDFGAKRLILESTHGPLVTEIRAAGPGHVVAMSPVLPLSGEIHRFEGFTVSGGLGPTDVGILVPAEAFVFVRRSIVRDCAGVGVKNEYDLDIQRTTIFGNGLGFWNAPNGVLWNPRHLIVWGNTIETDIAGYFGGSPIEHSILPSPCAACGTNTFYADPRFWDEGARDLHLRPGSPAILPGTEMGALPYDPSYAPEPANHCSAAPNSAGAGARISSSGSPSIAAASFRLHASGAPPNQFGLFLYAAGQAQVPFGDGFRCVTNPIFRLRPALSADGTGAFSRPLDFSAPPASSGPSQISPGSTWNFQLWYRDPAAGGSGFNLSDGLRAHFVP